MKKLYELEKEMNGYYEYFVKNQNLLERELKYGYTSDENIALTIEMLQFTMDDYFLSKKRYLSEFKKLEKLKKRSCSEYEKMEKWAIEWVIDRKLYGAILTDINQVSKTEQEFKKKGITSKTTYYQGVK